MLRVDIPPEEFLKYVRDNLYSRITLFVVHTRNYETGMEFAKVLEDLSLTYRPENPGIEWDNCDQQIAQFKLTMMDKLDMWSAFLFYYAECKAKWPDFNPAITERLWVVQRKHERLIAGKKVNHLKHHPQSELTDRDLEIRLKQLARLFRTGQQ